MARNWGSLDKVSGEHDQLGLGFQSFQGERTLPWSKYFKLSFVRTYIILLIDFDHQDLINMQDPAGSNINRLISGPLQIVEQARSWRTKQQESADLKQAKKTHQSETSNYICLK